MSFTLTNSQAGRYVKSVEKYVYWINHFLRFDRLIKHYMAPYSEIKTEDVHKSLYKLIVPNIFF